MNILKLPRIHKIALSSALVLHASIATLMAMPTEPTLLNQQAINISFVAPSANSKKSSDKKLTVENNIIDNKNSIKAAKKEQNSAEEENIKSASSKETSGRQDPNAIATAAAESEPVFNADYLNNPAPVYPSQAKRANIQGKVLLNVMVNAEGKAAKVDVSKSSGSSVLDQAALAAVKEWRFIPAVKRGRAVQANVIVPVDFKII